MNEMRCVPLHQYKIIHNPVQSFLLQKGFPIQFTLGFLGNVLNLWVLTSDDAANIASDLLAAVSVCDIMFLFMMLPHSLASFDSLAYNYYFRFFYIKTKQHSAAVANWMSASAIWLILAVSLERFLIVRSPLRSKLYWEKSRMAFVLGTIFVATGVLTVYHHFEYDCHMVSFCNGTQLFDFCWPSSETHPAGYESRNFTRPSKAIQMYMRASTFFNAVLVVFVPILIAVLLNISMLRVLHETPDSSLETSLRNSSIYRQQQRSRNRVTITVISIGICFSLTHGPSAVMVIWELLAGYDGVGDKFYAVFSITNSLVVTGKTVNFILFCLSSEHFRMKCLRLFVRTFPTLSRSVSRFSRTNRGSLSDNRGSIRTLRSYRQNSAPERDVGSKISLTHTVSNQ